MKKVVILIFTGIILTSLAYSQKTKEELMTVKGIVTAFGIYCLFNAEIKSKKTKTITHTDSLGRFEIMVPLGDMLTFKAKGFEKNRRKVKEATDPIQLNMILLDGDKNREIAVDNGHISEENIAYALEHYNQFNNDFTKYQTMEDLFRGELVGVMIQKHSYGVKVYLNPTNAWFDPYTPKGPALYVLDGVVTERIEEINPWDVKSIKVLKGVEANMYGSGNTKWCNTDQDEISIYAISVIFFIADITNRIFKLKIKLIAVCISSNNYII